jgi:hypothetical protein
VEKIASSPSLTKNKIKKFKSEKNPIFALSPCSFSRKEKNHERSETICSFRLTP